MVRVGPRPFGLTAVWVAAVVAACVASGVAPARAQAQPVHVQIDVLASCPSGKLLRDQLAPLLAPGAQLAIDTDAPAPGAIVAALRDQGDLYEVRVGEVTRELDDPARACVERARVAAVFIALNVQQRSDGAAPSERDGRDGEDARLGVELELFAAGACASAIDRAAPSGGAGVRLTLDAWRFGFAAALVAPVEIALDPAQGVNGDVALLRVPLALSAAYLWNSSGVQLGPSLGLALDVLRMRGQNVLDAQTELRLNPGVLLAAELRAPLGRALAAVLRLSASAFPREYRLNVDPSGRLGGTPQLWFAASLGIGWAL